MEYWTITLSILGVLLAIYYYISSKYSDVFQQHGVPHQKPQFFLQYLMKTFVFPKSLPELIKEMYNIHPDAKYVGIYDFTKPIVVIRDLELLKSVTIKNFDAFEDHLFFGTGNQDPLFGNNLMALRGNRWRDIRALLSPSFTSSKMRAMFQLISGCTVRFSEYLSNLPREKRVTEMKEIFTRYGTDVIATCAFGIDVDSMRHPENDFYIYGKKAMNFNKLALLKIILSQHAPALSRLLKLKLMDDRTSEFFTSLVSDTIKARDERNITRPDMLQLMMDSRGKREPGRELTILDMTSQAFIFFLAGFESSSTLMSFASYVIACEPGVQERLQNEIDGVLENTHGQPTYEAINGMTYLNAVISETLRMYPVQVMTDRLCVKEFELPPALSGAKPYTMKKDNLIFIPTYALQHDARYFPEPEAFKPERFLDESKGDRYNFDAYHPFGLGPRMCIGNRFALLETKVLLFHLLARCQLNVCKKTPIPLRFKKNAFSLKPEGDFWLEIVPREKPHFTIANCSKEQQ